MVCHRQVFNPHRVAIPGIVFPKRDTPDGINQHPQPMFWFKEHNDVARREDFTAAVILAKRPVVRAVDLRLPTDESVKK